MQRKPNIAPKKQPRQPRSIATVAAIVEAATYILSHGGLVDFTSNKVAERAGVNVASFYQYFPNKEALLFHIVRCTWEEQFKRLKPILMTGDASPAERLRAFMRELILVEAAEVELRRGLRAASVDLRETPEFQQLLLKGTALFHGFLAEALEGRVPESLTFVVQTIAILITSFTERATDERRSADYHLRQAEFLADMLIARFHLA